LAAPTLVLHVYPPGASPGLSAKGLAPVGAAGALAALFRVQSNVVDAVWVSDALPPGGAFRGRDALVGSDLWAQVLAVVAESVGGAPTFHFNDYASQEDTLGLGIGSTSTTVSWS